MKTIELVQGSPEWHAHRATHFNASDAPAMMGCSKHKTRSQLLHELHTGITPEVDASQQFRFDEGHRFEALARPLGAQVIGEDLYPVVGTEGELSASFDGLTMDESIAFEHKSLNDELRAAMTTMDGAALPLAYRVQMEQQCAVSGCQKVLFMATKWAGDELVERREAWYLPDLQLRAQIVAGWAQFAQDLAAYVPPERAAAVVVAEPVQALPSVVVRVTGEIAIHENFDAFETAARDFLEHRLIRAPKTDQDFADLDVQIKAMKGAEAALEAAEAGWIAQIDAVSTAKQRKDMLAKLMRDNRLMAERLLTSEKERRRGEIVADGVKALKAHVDALVARIGKPYLPTIGADFGGAIKGKRSLSSMEEAVDNELNRAKLSANEIADRIQINLGTLRELAAELPQLFPDTAQIVQKAPDDLTSLVKTRIAEHRAAEAKKEEEQRERIRREELDRIEREQEVERQRIAREQTAQAAAAAPPPAPAAPPAAAAPAATPAPAPTVIAMPPRAQPAPSVVPTLSIGAINERLQHFTVTEASLRGLGFEPAGRERAAPRYHESDFPHVLAAIVAHVQGIQAKQAA
ncbi:YqaJ-like viral recombinase domain protein [compost metagenome]